MKDHVIAKEMCRGIQTSELAGAKSWTTILSRLMVSWTEKLSPGPSRNRGQENCHRAAFIFSSVDIKKKEPDSSVVIS